MAKICRFCSKICQNLMWNGHEVVRYASNDLPTWFADLLRCILLFQMNNWILLQEKPTFWAIFDPNEKSYLRSIKYIPCYQNRCNFSLFLCFYDLKRIYDSYLSNLMGCTNFDEILSACHKKGVRVSQKNRFTYCWIASKLRKKNNFW